MSDFCVNFIMASGEEAEKIAKLLVEKKLAACVNIIPKVKSIYRWEGRICNESESLLIAKTKTLLVHELIKEVKEHHSYKVPEIISIPINDGNPDYLDWLKSETT